MLCDETAYTKYKIAPISGKRASSRICIVNIKAATVGVFRRTRTARSHDGKEWRLIFNNHAMEKMK